MALDLVSDPVWVFDITARRIWWANTAAVQLWRASDRDALLARDMSDMSESTTRRLQDYCERFQRGEVIVDEWTFYPNGEVSTVDCTFKGFALEGHVVMFVEAAIRDGSRIDHNVLRCTEALRHAKVVISLHSLSDGELLLQNPESAATFGDEQNFIERFVSPAEGAAILNAAQKNRSCEGEWQVHTRDGVCWHAMVIRQTNDPITGGKVLLLSAVDVTIKHDARAKLAIAKEMAEAVTQAKGNFLASMSHEIRTPLNGVIGLTQLLSKTALDEEQHRLLGAIEESSRVLLELINDVLDFSQMEAGQLKLDHSPFEIQDVVMGVLDLLSSQSASSNIDLIAAIAPNVPSVLFGDIGRVRQLLINLVGNALKFTE